MTSTEIIESHGKPKGALSATRIKRAAEVARNEEFAEYVAKRLDALRTEALMEDCPNPVMGDVVQANLLTVRGRLLELTDIYNTFMGYKATAEKPVEDINQ